MEVVIDGSVAPVVTSALKTFQELFESIHRDASQKGRVVVSVSLDGVALSREAQLRLKGEPLPSHGRLDVGTADRSRLALDTLGDLLLYLPMLDRSHQDAAQQVIAANYRDAMGRFKECFDGWARIMSALGAIAAGAGVDLGALRAGTQTVTEKILRIQDTLARFKTAFERTDVVGLADITQYDLKPLLEEARILLETLRARLLESAPASR